ncbi:MAG: LysM peptidoglycan-binding domain-containing protein [Bacteroidetes bacterium]|nr:LysM peptidoglycan-binding domain-containing protein [Bacteroidota bacterium]
MMVRYPALFILFGFCVFLQINASVFQPQPDTSTIIDTTALALVNSCSEGQDSLLSGSALTGDPVNPLIFDMLDSLVNMRFFSNTTFPEDTSVLNTHHYSPGEIPVFGDSVLQARIEKLNQTSLIELSYNKHVKSYLDVYAVKKRGLASRILGMAEVYFPLFEEQLDKYNLPLELKYLAVVESALNPIANSRAGAKGLWQFMYNTGKLYGLKANSLVDDRFDPYKATDAACRHLKDLYGIYGDWALVLAAYNSGAGNVNKAIRRSGGVKNYWAIWSYLPRETRGYVPAFVAVMYLMNYASEHNLYPAKPLLFFEEIDTVLLNDVLSFEQISEYLKIPEDELRFLNPAYKAGIIPATKEKQFVLRLPNRYMPSFIEYEKEIYAYKTSKGIEKAKLLSEVKKAKEQNIHVVKSGESLGVIAKKYHCSVISLKSWNNLRSNMIHPGQKLVINGGEYNKQPELTASKPVTSPKPLVKFSADNNIHIVAAGENLQLISQKYNCSVDDLKKWNNLQDSTIKPDQELIVKRPEITTEIKNNPDEMITSEDYIYHIVRKGDTLWDIARKYEGVTVEQIKMLNNITNTKKLKPGQKLRVGKKG